VDDEPLGVALAGQRDGAIGDRRRRHGTEVVVPGVLPHLVERGERGGVEVAIGPRVARHHDGPRCLRVVHERVLQPLRGGAADRSDRLNVTEEVEIGRDRAQQVGPAGVEDDENVPLSVEDVRPVVEPPPDGLQPAQVGGPEAAHSRLSSHGRRSDRVD